MKHVARFFLIPFLFFALHGRAAEQIYPKLFFSYSSLYDNTVCSPNLNPLNPIWVAEAESRVSEFDEIWKNDATKIFDQFFKDFKNPFSRRELTATLTACQESWSYSDPLVIRILPFLKSFSTSTTFPLFPSCGFTSMVFHELLHSWLLENFDISKSALYAKYEKAGESRIVLAHLRLMAIQKHIYTEITRTDLLKFIDWNYSNMPDRNYPRAWEIVNKIEGSDAFVYEIKEQISNSN